MFRFGQPEYLFLLLILPAIFGFYVYTLLLKKRDLKRYGNPELLSQLMPDVSRRRPPLKFWLLLSAIAMVIIVMAGPQFGSKLDTVKRKGIEVMICLDLSNSMNSKDVEPSRLEKSKMILSKLVDGLDNDKIGMIVFAGQAYVQLPITSDYVSAKMFFSSLNTRQVPTQGTAIGEAINMAVRSFTPKEDSEKAIVVITDGENHEDDAVGAAQIAAKKGIHVNVIGVGSLTGAPIPDERGDFRKDQSGNVVITKLNEDMCRQIAQAGKGVYDRADNSNHAQKTIQKELAKLKKADIEGKVYSEYDEQFQSIAWLALILLIIEFIILERKNKLTKNIRLFK
ncbi:vWA domain-containing protein [Parabacteroides sp. FAFU027]|uniref:vWA domain-containing protein n=1 Tax=Parabacteroides sp. FAFU027 TaxID=2922715 RepID=UPI001FB010A9|nr:VWA domain-containing protein [Parabacteroides sp. FAFU027]